jgi:hypothetical protein
MGVTLIITKKVKPNRRKKNRISPEPCLFYQKFSGARKRDVTGVTIVSFIGDFISLARSDSKKSPVIYISRSQGDAKDPV